MFNLLIAMLNTSVITENPYNSHQIVVFSIFNVQHNQLTLPARAFFGCLGPGFFWVPGPGEAVWGAESARGP